MKRAIAVAILAALTACGCGGGGSDAPSATPQTSQPQARTDLLFLGNSLTYLPVDANYVVGSRDWGQGGWGAVATAPERDYVHIVASSLNMPFVAMNLADNERDYSAPLPKVTVNPGTIIVVQLGDNGLPARYREILQIGKGAAVVCISTYWNAVSKDNTMRAICESVGGKWVDITGVQVKLNLYDNPGVDLHPGDAQMAEIAKRVLAAIK